MRNRIFTALMATVFAALLFASIPANTASANSGRVHCMKYGETLHGVGYYYGVSAHAIAQYNGIYNPNYVRAGRCLHIPGYGHGGHGHKVGHGHHGGHGHHVKPAPRPAKKHHAGGYYYGGRYCVGYGDTLYNIGYRHGVSPYAIAKANGIYNANYIRVGQCLRIPTW